MEIDEALTGVDRGRFPAGIYSDPGLHQLERERLFSRTWQFLAHESEVPEPGDYVVRRILDDSFIVARDDAGRVNVLLNMCRHRGMQVCRAEAGNASHFRCPYHAWTYRNDGRLVGVPFHAEAYGGDAGLDKAANGLVPPPRVDSYRGLVFASLDPTAPPLAEHLGGAAFYLDLYLHQSVEGVELRGPQRWQVDCNWKIGAENFSGDSYHTPHTHVSVVEIGLFLEPKAHKRKEGALWWAGAAGGTTYKLPSADLDENLAYIGYPPEMVARMKTTWSPAQQDLVGRRGFIVSASTVFPNLSLVHNWPRVHPDTHVVPFISLRLWQPLGPTSTEVCSWFVVDRGAPQDYKEASYRAYLMSFGSSGMFEQDDVENWTSITSVAKGRFAASVALDSTMGLSPDGGTLRPPLEDWPGPGTAHVGYGEYNQRRLLELWAAHLAAAPARTDGASSRRPSGRERGMSAAAHEAAGLPAPVGAAAHADASAFLTLEARLLDLGRYTQWLGLLDEDVRYRMPVRVTAARGQQGELLGGMDHFDEDRYSLAKRVERLVGQHAWTEDPPSRTRRFVTNVWVSEGGASDEWDVVSYLLLFRSRLDVRAPELVSAERSDVLARTAEGLRLRSRLITVDESVLRTQNLAVFL